MIGSLRGTLLDRQPARTGPGAEVLLEVAGVGYRVVVPAGTAGVLGEVGGVCFLHVHTHVREDAIVLYGFATRRERVCFEALLGAHGVGPGLALAIITVHAPAALQRVLLTDDVDALCLVPGVGRKTAAKLLLELKARLDLPDFDGGVTVPAAPAEAGPPAPHTEVRAALSGLGYAPDEVRAALAALPPEGTTEDLLRQALRARALAR
jgi:Holliday junction DNA helicase RuvA